ncbi:LA_2272/LA_2273 family lipoprotein [Leptospira santarosai]|uniref:LA_2272/LA_2273 family lipoprotein n=1 Tax=Leptospira santarosai TaxID=28183 RepID=UPI0007733C12
MKLISILFFLLSGISISNCGFALTPKITTTLPPQEERTKTEVFRFNLLYGELMNLIGINVGIVNTVENRMIGAQAGVVNFSNKDSYGAQVSIYNSSKNRMAGVQLGIVNLSEGNTYGAQVALVNKAKDKGAGIQAGIVNYSEGQSVGVQAGIVNMGAQRTGFDLTVGAGNFQTKGFMIGALNLYSEGVNLGILNEQGNGFNLGALNIQGKGVNVGILNGGTGVHIGLINASGEEEDTDEPTLEFGLLNFCGKGTFPVMIFFNYCK